MRICYVCADPGIPVFGTKGASVHVQETIRAMRRAGHQVRLVCVRRGALVPGDLAGLPVTEAGLPTGSAADRESALIALAAELPRLALGEAAGDSCDLVYERCSLFSAAVLRAAATAGVPGVLEVNAPLIDEQLRHRTLVHRADAESALLTAVESASLVVCVSDAVRQWVLRRAPAARTAVVPNGVDPTRFAAPSAASPAVHGAPLVVGFVGTLKPWHGVETLIAAVASVRRPLRLLVVGDGPRLEVCRRLAAETGVAAEFTGAVEPGQVPGLLQRMDVAVNPAATGLPPAERYFSPLKIFEYAAAGRAIVSADAGQAGRLLEHGRTALLVPPGDPGALAAALDRLAAHPRLRADLGRAARTWAAGQSWDAAVERILAGVAMIGTARR